MTARRRDAVRRGNDDSHVGQTVAIRHAGHNLAGQRAGNIDRPLGDPVTHMAKPGYPVFRHVLFRRRVRVDEATRLPVPETRI